MDYRAADKYRQMLRSFEQIKKIASNNGNTISNTDSRDAAEGFFTHAYHLKDWLKKDPTVSISGSVEGCVSKNEALSLAADYCNSFKHTGTDRKSRSGGVVERVNTHIKLEMTPRGFVASSTSTVTIGGKIHDTLTLAKQCIEAWDRFLEENNTIFHRRKPDIRASVLPLYVIRLRYRYGYPELAGDITPRLKHSRQHERSAGENTIRNRCESGTRWRSYVSII